jgi:micrococcal nuclease
MRMTLVCVAALLAACSAGATPARESIAPATTNPTDANATIDRVVDGDTVDVIIDGSTERVRLIGIDTPETVKPDSPVECFGPEASAYTKHLLPEGTPVRLERDAEARDDYGRLLAYVFVIGAPGPDDDLFVNLEIVREGYAALLTFPPNVAHVDEFVEAARAAEAADLGLWAACAG